MGIDERLVSRPHLLPSRFTRTGSDGYTPGSCCANSGPIPARTRSPWPCGSSVSSNAHYSCSNTSEMSNCAGASTSGKQRRGPERTGQSGVLQPARGTARPHIGKPATSGQWLKFGRGSNCTLEHGLPGAGYSSAPQPRADDP